MYFREVVSEETNQLDITEREQYVFKWLRAYKNNLLKGGENDPDFDHTAAEDFDDDDEWKYVNHGRKKFVKTI